VKLDVYKINGTKTGEQVSLVSKVFGVEPNDHAIWLAVTSEQAHQRQGTAAAKNRSAVSGGGKKPWRQKGRGVARAGSTRSPLWRGGGRVFGPSPRQYKKKTTRKMNQLARRSALSYKAKAEKIQIVEDFTFESPKTRQMATMLEKLKLAGVKTLLLVAANDHTVWLSGRNIPLLYIREAANFSTYDVMNADVVLIQKTGLTKIEEVLAK